MRRDIRKVVFERAKSGRTWASKTPRAKQIVLDQDGEQLNEGSNSTRQKRRKFRNSHFNAVEHFLVRNIGRPWSKVYAEVCAAADARSLLGAEIRDFVQSFVATQCWLDGRKVMRRGCGGCPGEVRGLYVHPASGLLRRAEP